MTDSHFVYLYDKTSFRWNICTLPMPVACSSLIAGIRGSIPAEGMDFRLLCLLCVV
jgi:hypothetical protein